MRRMAFLQARLEPVRPAVRPTPKELFALCLNFEPRAESHGPEPQRRSL